MDFLKTISALLGDASSVGVPNAKADEANLTNIVNLVGTIAGVIAIIVIIIAGINYSMSSGDPAKTTKSLHTILYAVISLVIIASATLITHFIIGRIV